MSGSPPLPIEPLRAATDPKWFRQILSQYPTGVSLVTSIDEDGTPIGLTMGSFTSVSLDPPLIAFLPQRTSSTYAKIRKSGRFCVNILGSDQEEVCRVFASPVADRFASAPYRLSPSGLPIVRNCVAWIECTLHDIFEAGDHDIVLGRVERLDSEASSLPLLFYQGGYGHFSSISLTIDDPLGQLARQLRQIDLGRPHMEELASRLGARCIASVRTGDEVVIAASSGSAHRGGVETFVGQKVPFLPPGGAAFAAWLDEAEQEAWLARAPHDKRQSFREALGRVRDRGYSLALASEAQREFANTLAALSEGAKPELMRGLRGLMTRLSYEPADLGEETCRAVRLISVPVQTPGEAPSIVLTLYDFPRLGSGADLQTHVDALQAMAARFSDALPPEKGRTASTHQP